MKKNVLFNLLLLLTLISGICYSQPNTGFYYQAAIRDAAGKAVSKKTVSLRVNLHRGAIDSPTHYSETHTVETSPLGIVNLFISQGENVDGDFGLIEWGTYNYFIELELDQDNSGDFVSMGTTQIVSVPIANYAMKAGNVNFNDTSSTNEIQSLIYENDSLKLSKTPGGIKIENTGGIWSQKDDIIYNTDKSVVVGSDTLLVLAYENVQMQINANNNTPLNGGVAKALTSNMTVGGDGIECKVDGNLTSATSWIGYGKAVGVFGQVRDLGWINNNAAQTISGAGGGVFNLEMDELRFGSDTFRFHIAGVEARIKGTLQEHPDSAIISGLIALDEINGEKTYAGYFRGKTYITDKLGIGVPQPARSLHIGEAIRFEPLLSPPTSPAFGDLYADGSTNSLLFYSGSKWDTLNSTIVQAGNDNWNISGDVTYALSESVGIGATTTTGDHTRLELNYTGNDKLTYGEKRNLHTHMEIFAGPTYTGTLETSIGLGKVGDNWSAGVALYSGVKSLTQINNDALWESGSAGGIFDMNCSGLSFENDAGTYRVVGMEAKLRGTVTEYPANAIISGMYVLDGINSSGTYAAYIDGRTYINGAVGIGVKQPERALHVKDIMRLEPRATEPSVASSKEGDIYYDSTTHKLRVFDGTAWRDCF